MRIESLRISNFRAIENFEAKDLGDFVVIAGPNGCGKTSVLDAIRLLKSLYVHNEWHRWFQEFGIEIQRPTKFPTLFRDSSSQIELEAIFALSNEERDFIASRSENIAFGLVLNENTRKPATITGDAPLVPPDLSPNKKAEIQAKAERYAKTIAQALADSDEFTASATITMQPKIDIHPSPIATAAFSCFNPDALGEIEFHGSRRLYSRESVNNIRLSIGDRSEERRSRFLYDLENKYKNIKTQLGEEYVAAILKDVDPDSAPLQRSIRDLFRNFFPGKEFSGVELGEDNSMSFPVLLNTGEIHDIDELSSGEKEIVYGYLWLRTGTPKRSVVLVDEPELHLNPALVQGLPIFYQTHIADALEAQVWIVTHSDAILRQAVRASQMAVFHMARPFGDGKQQAIRIDNQDLVEAAVLDLIGDLAAYRPHAKIVLVEGSKETRFDVDMIRRLFPDLAERGNFVPVGNRQMTTGVRVRLLEVLKETGLTGRAVSISDRDLNLTPQASQGEGEHYTWPVYEIENFLLRPSILRGAAEMLLRKDPFGNDKEVVNKLRKLATDLVDELALREVQNALNIEFTAALSIGGSRENAAKSLEASAKTSQKRVGDLEVSIERISSLLAQSSEQFCEHLRSEEFLLRFPGDRLLRAVAGSLGISGDHFRNACLDQAQRLNVRPAGMEAVLREALA